MPLMLMRRYEVEYRLTRADPVYSSFKDERASFEKAFGAIVAAAIMKQQLNDQVKVYTDAFAQWIESTGKIARGIAVISAETRQMLPAADEIIAAAGQRAAQAADGVSASQQQTKMLIIAIGVAVVLIGLLLNWLIGRGITGPLARLSGAMERLATGDTSVDIPATDAKDEIGAMARTVIVFRDNALEREQLSVTQEKSVRERERRSRDDRRDDRAASRARSIEALGKVRGAARSAGDRVRARSTARPMRSRRSRAPPRSASARPRSMSPRRRARPRSSRPRSARSPARPRPRPRSRAAPSPRRSARSRPCRSSPAPRRASAR